MRGVLVEAGFVAVFFAAVVVQLTSGGGAQLAGPVPFSTETMNDNEVERWMGIYVDTAKIGHSVHREESFEDGSVILRERTYIRLSAFGTEREIRLRVDAHLDAQSHLEEFEAHMFTEPIGVSASGKRVGDQMSVTVLSGDTVLKEMKLDPDAALPINLYPELVAQNPEPGTVVRSTMFDPSTLTIQPVSIRVMGWEQVPQRTDQQGLHLQTDILGSTTNTWVDKAGHAIREEGLLGMVAIRESRNNALSRGWEGGMAPDIISLSAVPVRGNLFDERPSKWMSARITGAPAIERFLGDQYGSRFENGVLTNEVVNLEAVEDYLLPASDQQFAAYLVPEPLIEADDPKILDLANDLARGDAEAILVAERLNSWVYHQIEKTPVFGIPGAKTTLEQRKGDCNEHTALFTAMARAVGLPTRVAAGIVWTDGMLKGGAFYYHAWPEIWLGSWVPIDPTFNQFPADPTHIRLVVGDLSAQTELVGVIGKLEVEVIEAQ